MTPQGHRSLRALPADLAVAEDRRLGVAPVAGWYSLDSVKLDDSDERLLFDVEAGERMRKPRPALLPDFIAMAYDAAPWAFLKYAKRYGALGVRADGAPAARESEELDDWRVWAQRADSLIQVSSALQRGRQPDDRHVEVLRRMGRKLAWSRRNYKTYVALRINDWLDIQRLHLVVQWSPRVANAEYVVQTPGLFGALGLALAAAITHSGGFASCRGCGRLFPLGQRRVYCNDCGRAQAVRDASRRYRDRQRAKRSETSNRDTTKGND